MVSFQLTLRGKYCGVVSKDDWALKMQVKMLGEDAKVKALVEGRTVMDPELVTLGVRELLQ
jgi:hypothetical protein